MYSGGLTTALFNPKNKVSSTWYNIMKANNILVMGIEWKARRGNTVPYLSGKTGGWGDIEIVIS